MSLIDRLGKEAQKAREDRENAERLRLEREERYSADFQGRMMALHEYLAELVKHLQELRPVIALNYQLSGYGDLPALVLHDYKLEAERRMLSYVINIHWRARIDHEKCREVVASGHTRIRQLIDQFRALHIGGIRELNHGNSGDLVEAKFHPKGFLHLSMRAILHAHDPLLRLSFVNLDVLGTTHKQFPGDAVGAELFDRLGRFFVREDNDLIVERLPEELRQRLRGPAPAEPEHPLSGWEPPTMEAVDFGIDVDPSRVPRAPSFNDPVSEQSSVAPSNPAEATREAIAAKPTAPATPPSAPVLTKEQRDRELLLAASPKAPAPDEERIAALVAEFAAAEQDQQGKQQGEVRRLEIQPLSMSLVEPPPPTAPPAAPTDRRANPEAGSTANAARAPAEDKSPPPPSLPGATPPSTQAMVPPPQPPSATPEKDPELSKQEADAFRERMRITADRLRHE